MSDRDSAPNECNKIVDVHPVGWVWMFYYEKSRLARQFGIGPFLFYKWLDEPWWKWEFHFNPD